MDGSINPIDVPQPKPEMEARREATDVAANDLQSKLQKITTGPQAQSAAEKPQQYALTEEEIKFRRAQLEYGQPTVDEAHTEGDDRMKDAA